MTPQTTISMLRQTILSDYRQLLSLSIPILIASISSTLIGIIDTAMMGHFSVSGLAAVASGAAVFAIISNVIAAATMGYQVLAAKYFGAETPGRVGSSFWHSLLFIGGLAIASIVALFWTATWLAELTAQSPEVVIDAVGYLQVRSPSLVLLVLASLLTITFNADKQTHWGMYATFIAGGANILFDYPLIFGLGPIPALGAIGNGMGSTLAIGVEVICLIWVAFRQHIYQQLWPASLSVKWSEIVDTVRLSWPAMLSAALDYAANLIFFMMIGALGTVYLAAGRLAFNLDMIMFIITTSLAVGCQILVGRAWGAEDIGIAQRYRQRNQELMIVILGLLSLPLLIWPEAIMSLFTSFAEVKGASAGAVRIIGLAMPFMAWSYNNVAVLRALGRTKWDMYANVLPVWLVQLPVGWLGFMAGWGINGVYFGFAAYWISRALMTHLMVSYSFSAEFQNEAVL